MSHNDRNESDISRTWKAAVLICIVLFFIFFPLAYFLGRCALTGDCL